MITNLTTGEYYSLFLQSVNFNGVSVPGLELVAPVCLAPNHIDSMEYISSTKNSITVGWDIPTYTGGCPILSFALYVDDGLGVGNFTEVDPNWIENKPYLTMYTVTGLNKLGNVYSFYIQVINEIGYV